MGAKESRSNSSRPVRSEASGVFSKDSVIHDLIALAQDPLEVAIIVHCGDSEKTLDEEGKGVGFLDGKKLSLDFRLCHDSLLHIHKVFYRATFSATNISRLYFRIMDTEMNWGNKTYNLVVGSLFSALSKIKTKVAVLDSEFIPQDPKTMFLLAKLLSHGNIKSVQMWVPRITGLFGPSDSSELILPKNISMGSAVHATYAYAERRGVKLLISTLIEMPMPLAKINWLSIFCLKNPNDA